MSILASERPRTAAETPTVRTAEPERRERSSWWLPVAGIAASVALWWLATDVLFAGRALMRDFSPSRTLVGLRELAASGALLADASSSVYRLAAGLLIAAVVGTLLGVGIGSVPWLEKATRPTLLFLRMVSPLSWAPIAIGLFGIGDPPVIALVAATTVWPVTLAAAAGVRSVDPGHLLVAKALGATWWERLRTVTAPSLQPHLLGGLRMAIGIGWVVLVPAEMLGVTSGLGYQILNAKDQLAYHHITALILVIGTIGYAVDVLARWLLTTRRERRAERAA
ncbi:ABC transporter permease [Actinomycetota bacterium]